MYEPQDDLSMGICGNPEHQAEERIFVRPVEERLSWERVIAGQSTGGMVPVKWRGCGHGCLDFLGVSTTASEEAAMDVDDVVQVVSFAAGLDFDT